MGGAIQFDGIIGAFILIATPILMAVIALISLIVYLAGKKSGQNELKWSKYFLISALIFLFLDGMILMLLFSQKTTLSREQAVLFDKGMILGWIPIHLIGYFLVTISLRFSRARRKPINKFIDKLR